MFQPGQFHYAHRRASRNAAGAARNGFQVWLEDWSVSGQNDVHVLAAAMDGIQLNLSLVPTKPCLDEILFQEARRKRYRVYCPRLEATGQLTVAGQVHDISGSTWMEREFGSLRLGKIEGWDWLAVQLEDGRELVAYIFRDQGRVDQHSTVTLVDKDGGRISLGSKDFTWTPLATWRSPATGAVYPSRWRFRVPKLALDLEIVPILNCQELDTLGSTMLAYWEGAAVVDGSMAGRALTGRAYVELVGYLEPLRRPKLLGCIAGELIYQLGGKEHVLSSPAGVRGGRMRRSASSLVES